MDVATVLNDMDAAKRAFERVQPDLDAIPEASFAPMNVDVVSATSIALGVTDRVVGYRDRLAALPEFDVRHVDKLLDYATAAWYVFITNLSSTTPVELQPLLQEATVLRAKLLMWAEPLAHNGNFELEALAKIKEGSGQKDIPGDLVALVGLYRSKWEQVRNLCAVTEADLDRGAQIGPFVFAMVSLKDQKKASNSKDALRVRRAWTLLDRAYDQCRRGLTFLLWTSGDVDAIAPSLRKNTGPRSSSAAREPAQQPAAPVASGGAPIGGAASPFAG